MPDADPTSTTNHAYDNTELDSLQFLAAVMHAPEADLADRIVAAEALLPFVKAPLQPSVRPLYVNGVPSDKDVIVKVVISEMPGLSSVSVDTRSGVNENDLGPVRTN
jgi:hypothetical protein